mgnify:CR=1 FL=1
MAEQLVRADGLKLTAAAAEMGKAGGFALGVEKIKPVAIGSPRTQIVERFLTRLHIVTVRESERGDPLRCGVRFSGVGT